LDLALWGVPVPHHTTAAAIIRLVGMHCQERLDLGLDRLHQHASGACPQHALQGIIGKVRSWPGQGNDGILVHGLSSW